jgi:DNA-binding response OmpR family regulator
MTKILVIEDELAVRENIVDLLEAEGFEVYSTENGIIGALWSQDHTPDLIICDVMMPEIDGYEVLTELRQAPMTALTPFIFLTALADKTDIRKGMKLGADDYLTKPFTRNELLEAISSRLAKHESLMKHYNAEHQRAEALQQKFNQLQSQANLSQESQNALQKLNLAINLLQKVQPGKIRSLAKGEAHCDRNFRILQEICRREIDILKHITDVPNYISQENADLISALINLSD